MTIVSASIEGRRPDGTPWHTKKTDGVLKLVAGVAGAAMGSAELGMQASDVLSGHGDIIPPSPYVEVHIAGREYQTYAENPTLAPAWNHELVVELAGESLDEQVAILVKDGFDDATLGQHVLSLRDLLAKPRRTVLGMKSVPTLSIAVGPMPDRTASSHQLWVPADRTADDLRTRGAKDWKAVPVEAGDVIVVSAEGSACTSRWSACTGPEGDLSGLGMGPGGKPLVYSRTGDNYRDFPATPHGELVGMVAGAPARVGARATFTARRSGDVVLFVNDTDVGNNSGGFRVTVEVNPPAER